MAPSVPAVTGLRSTTRPETSQTNKTLRAAALQTLCTPRSAREEVPVQSAHSEAKALTDSLEQSRLQSQRIPRHAYASMGSYRPYMRPADEVKKESLIEALRNEKGEEFAKMLEMIGEKSRQKFCKARDVFRFVDNDHNLKLSRSEVRFFFRFFNVGPVQADKFFDGFDTDEDGEICYVEFLKYIWPHVNPGNEQTPWRLTKEVRDEEQSYRDGDLEAIDVSKPLVSPSKLAKSNIELPSDLRIARINIAQRLNLRYKNSRDAFRVLDGNRDGRVSQEEMRVFLTNLGWEHVADKFFMVMTKDGKEHACFDEFTRLFDVSRDLSALRLRL